MITRVPYSYTYTYTYSYSYSYAYTYSYNHLNPVGFLLDSIWIPVAI